MKTSCNILFAGLSGIAVLAGAAHAADIAARIDEGQTVRQGVANDAPYGFVDKSGETVGIEVELAERLLKELGAAEIETIATNFGGLIPGVQADRFDLASDGIYIRPERCRVITFAEPHFQIGVGAFTTVDSDIEVDSMVELAKMPDLRIGLLTGAAEGKVYQQAGGNPDQLFDFADRQGLAAGLKSDRIDVAFLTSMGAAAIAAADDGIKLITPFKQLEVDGKPQVFYAGFAFSKADEDFVDQFNEKLTAFIHSPEYVDLLAKYDVPADVIPGKDVKLADLCTE